MLVIWHWTGQKIRVHVSYCVTALAVAHLMRREAARAGLALPARELRTILLSAGLVCSSSATRRPFAAGLSWPCSARTTG